MKKEELNKFQKAVVESNSTNIVVTACAGSGKTSSLIFAVVEYRKKNPGHTIDIITYTRAATAVLKERLSAEGVYDANISTIHVWSRERLKDLSELYHFKLNIIEKPAIMQILTDIVSKHRTKINVDIVFSYVTGNKKMDVSDSYLKTLDSLNTKYIRYKRDNGLYDFTDYPLYLLVKLKEYKEKIYSTDALFVDELQDVDEEQSALFELVEARKKFYIGDSWQAIFGFRGADSKVFDNLDNFDHKKLKINYRSYQEITDYATTVYQELRPLLGSQNLQISRILWSRPSGIECSRGYGGNVYVLDMFGKTLRISADSVVAVDTGKTISNFLKTEPMILCRTNKQVKAFIDCGYNNATTVHQAKGLEYKNVICIDALLRDDEDLNIAYVAITRAEDNVLIANFQQMYKLVE